MPIDWETDLSTGIDDIDCDHRELIKQMHRVMSNWQQGSQADRRQDVFDIVMRHVVWHFDSEEELMCALGFPNAHEHMKEHARIRDYVRARKQELDDEGSDAELSDVSIRLIFNRLAAHIRTADREFARFVRAKDAD